ncbi:hypothetical protein D3C79_369340 [compost metagenome]
MAFTAKAISAACQKLNGVIQHNRAPISVANATPPTRPSRVFEGDRLGATLRLPNSLPHTYCNTSLICTTRISQAISNRLRPSKPGMSRVSKAGTEDTQYTAIIKPHCTFDARSRKRVVSPPRLARIGSSKNRYTGMKMLNRPYQSMAISRYCTGSAT